MVRTNNDGGGGCTAKFQHTNSTDCTATVQRKDGADQLVEFLEKASKGDNTVCRLHVYSNLENEALRHLLQGKD